MDGNRDSGEQPYAHEFLVVMSVIMTIDAMGVIEVWYWCVRIVQWRLFCLRMRFVRVFRRRDQVVDQAYQQYPTEKGSYVDPWPPVVAIARDK